MPEPVGECGTADDSQDLTFVDGNTGLDVQRKRHIVHGARDETGLCRPYRPTNKDLETDQQIISNCFGNLLVLVRYWTTPSFRINDSGKA